MTPGLHRVQRVSVWTDQISFKSMRQFTLAEAAAGLMAPIALRKNTHRFYFGRMTEHAATSKAGRRV